METFAERAEIFAKAVIASVTQLTDNERWGVGLAVVAIIVPLVNHAFAVYREHRAASRKAAQDFRDALLNALNGLYPLAAHWPDDIEAHLRSVFPKIQTAVAQFRPCVPFRKRRAFDRAWSRYRSATGRPIDVQCYLHYMDFLSPDEPPTDGRANFRRNVDALLAFARVR
jgi:hypothetical protein